MRCLLVFLFIVAAAPAWACQIYYRLESGKFNWLKFAKNDVPFALTKEFKELPLLAQIEELQEFNRVLARKIDEAKEEFKILALNESRNSAEAINIYRHLHQEMKRELAHYTDYLVEQVGDKLKQFKVNSRIEIHQLDDETPYKVLLILAEKDSASSAGRHIHRLQQRFKVRAVEFDPMSLLETNFTGLFMPGEGTVKLSARSITSMFADDVVSGVALHEFQHGAFQRMRQVGKDSIYHVEYTALGRTPLSDGAFGYDKFMSGEELYNYLNDPLWLMKRMKNDSFWKHSELNDFFDDLTDHLKFTEEIVHQSRTLSREALEVAQDLRDAPVAVKFRRLSLFTDAKEPVYYARDAAFVSFQNPITQHHFTYFIPLQMRKKLKVFDHVDQQLAALSHKRFGRSYYKLSLDDQQLIESFVDPKQMRRLQEFYDQLLGRMESVQRQHLVVADIADDVLPELSQRILKLDVELQKHFKESKLQTLENQDLRKRLLEIRREFADFGRRVRAVSP